MAIVITFLLGMGNFAWHRAVIESGHAMVRNMQAESAKSFRIVSLAMEFLLLCGTLYASFVGHTHWVWAYFAYSLLNGGAAWIIVKGRM